MFMLQNMLTLQNMFTAEHVYIDNGSVAEDGICSDKSHEYVYDLRVIHNNSYISYEHIMQ